METSTSNYLVLQRSLRALHAVFCELSGQQPPYSTCERRLLEFHNAGFAEDDLRLVIEHVKRENKKRDFGFQLSMRFDKLIGDIERFGDLLGSSRADKRARDFKARNSYPAAKAEVLRATGRPDSKPLPEPQQAKEVMEGLLRKGFEQALKEAEESKQVSL